MHDEKRLAQIAQLREAVLFGETDLSEALASVWDSRAWIMQSWRRCLDRGQQPDKSVAFDPVPANARAHTAEANARLLAAARPELDRLAKVIAPLRYFVIVTDVHGTVIDTTGVIDHRNRLTQAIARIGVDLSEHSIGTTAVGAALREHTPVWLHRGEHFFRDTGACSCAGAPLFGPDGNCLGMLDVTGIEVPERPEIKYLVTQSAQDIEDALVLARPHALSLHLTWPTGSKAGGGNAGGGLLCLDAEGGVVGANGAARRMLPALRDLAHGCRMHASDLFAMPWPALFDLAVRGDARIVPLWSGLQLQASAQSNMSKTSLVRAHGQTTLHHPAPRSLKALETDLIHQAVRDAGGRVSTAAKALGVSRATVYRRLTSGPNAARGDGSEDRDNDLAGPEKPARPA